MGTPQDRCPVLGGAGPPQTQPWGRGVSAWGARLHRSLARGPASAPAPHPQALSPVASPAEEGAATILPAF